jgi:hypothetical protein
VRPLKTLVPLTTTGCDLDGCLVVGRNALVEIVSEWSARFEAFAGTVRSSVSQGGVASSDACLPA